MGSIDLFYLLIALFAMSIGVILSIHITNTMVVGLNQSVGGSNTYIQKASADVTNTFLLFDAAIVEVFFGLAIIAIASAFLIKSHPIFYFFTLIAIIIILAVTPSIANGFFDFVTNPTIVATANNFPLTIQLFQSLPTILLIISVLIAIATLAKQDTGTVDTL